MTEKRFENRLNKDKKYFNVLNPVWDNKNEDALNVFEMIDLLNALHEENEQLKIRCGDGEQIIRDLKKENEKLKRTGAEVGIQNDGLIMENEQLRKQLRLEKENVELFISPIKD